MDTRRVRCQLIVALLSLAFISQACGAQTKGVGDALLDDYVKATAVSSAREASERKVRAALDELDHRVQEPPGEALPKEFVERYRRLLDATRAVISSQRDQDTHAKLREYVTSINGTAPREDEMISATADAFFTEIARLRKLLRK